MRQDKHDLTARVSRLVGVGEEECIVRAWLHACMSHDWEHAPDSRECSGLGNEIDARGVREGLPTCRWYSS
jgi:hypothetical protein